ncbi:sodium/myo-inositol cotransporter isoform X2 [Tetranychus urticae]|uniref:sodium/myo-inositol cotransporter isoform X2 n=1 Tax=Tetranychus urticae TaxID=32264 RepID=UPI00077BF33F|nr:sodium/myo-inositol cotransporter isoform X2 [Tetranychus urticae]
MDLGLSYITVYTLPEFMSKRFGGKRIQTYLALLSLLLYVFTKISVNLFSGAIFIQQARGWSIYVSVLILLALTAVSTVTGGLASVMYTDTIQCFVMLAGGILLTYKAINEIGGIGNLKPRYFEAKPSVIPVNATTCAMPKDTAFLLLRPIDDHDMPWLGFLAGQTFASMWYWCTDQVIVQRLLAAKNLAHAQGGTLLAGFLKLMPLFIIIIPGMISRILFPDDVSCVDPVECYRVCQSYTGCSNIAYPRLVLALMPSGLKGLMMAGMLAALMSGLSSIFNSCSTMFTIDIWPLIRPKASVREQMIVGRSFTFAMIAFSIAWIVVIQEMQSGELYIYIQAISSILSPPIATVYGLSVIWPRMNEPAAFWTLIIGLVIGSVRFILDIIYREPPCGEPDLRPSFIKDIHYMYFALILTIISVITSVFVSLITKPTENFRLIRTTYWTRFDESIRDDEVKPVPAKTMELTDMDWHEEDDKCDVDLEEGEEADDVMIKDKKVSLCKKFFIWFCGYEDTEQSTSKSKDPEGVGLKSSVADAFESHSGVASLRQTLTQKIILRTTLALIVVLSVFLFTYFSLPFHMHNSP